MPRILNVYLHNNLAGKLTQNDDGRLEFQYNIEYIIQNNSMPLSVAIPFREERYEDRIARPFFSGLLPDDNALVRVAKFLGISHKNPFALLEIIGGECAGAVSLYPESYEIMASIKDEVSILDEENLLRILELLKQRPLLAGEEGLRLSLAGAQDKLPVSLIEDQIVLVNSDRPTTHILKPLISGVEDSVHNELFCMQLAKMSGLEVPECTIKYAGNVPVFLIERYDRNRDENGYLIRIHQEDFCQALSIPPEIKYQNEGGPGIAGCLELVKNYSRYPAKDNLLFISVLIFNYMIGNADAHGKNYALLYREFKPGFAPVYDLICTEIYSNLSHKMAMKIGSKYEPYDVMMRHWMTIVPDMAAARNMLKRDLKNMAEKLPELARTLKKNLEDKGIRSNIYDKIVSVIDKRSKHVLNYFE
ncbi:MAG: type II toxin-antitoxin system HipA family toxin [Cyanobacteriota bacterium]